MNKRNLNIIYILLFIIISTLFCMPSCKYDVVVDPVVSDDPVTPVTSVSVSPECTKIQSTTSPTQTASLVITESPTQTAQATPAITQTPVVTVSPTHSAEPTPTFSPTQTLAPTPTPTPTPTEITPTLEFSHKAGFYSDSFILKLDYDNSYRVYFTKNGSEPTSSSSKYKSDGIKIYATDAQTGNSDNINVIKAALFTTNGKKVSKTYTMTYIVNRQYTSFSDRYANLAVISISCENDALYNSKTGIFYHDATKSTYEQNYMQRGRQWERACHVEMFETGGDIVFSIDAGLRIFGGTSRGLPQKSLRLIARKEYDPENGKFKHPIFPDRTDIYGNLIDEYDSFILRSGGNDSLFGSSARNTFFRDDLTGILASGIDNVASMYSRTVVVYINGTYWGFYNMRDDTDTDFLQEKYNVPKDDIGIITYGHENGTWGYDVDSGPETVLNDYKAMVNTISSLNMSIQSNYETAEQLLDIDGFIKYMLINMYVNNRDWPHNNVRAWKYTGENPVPGTYSDGKWRFIVKDTDYAWGIYDLPGRIENVVATETAHNKSVVRGEADNLSVMLMSLLKNDSFKTKFINIACDICNEYFETSKVNLLLDSFIRSVKSEYQFMATQTWYGSAISQLSYDTWKMQNMQTLYDYALIRPDIFRNFIKENVLNEEIVDLEVVIINPEYGNVKVSSIVLDTKITEWAGKYFTNNEIPLLINPDPDHTFTVSVTDGNGDITESSITISDANKLTITITFS